MKIGESEGHTGSLSMGVAASLMVITGLMLWIIRLKIRQNSDPYNQIIPGPKSTDVVFGHVRSFLKARAEGRYPDPTFTWIKEYGTLFIRRGLFNVPMLMVTDPGLIKHIVVTKPNVYQRNDFGKRLFRRWLGGGVLTLEGKEHQHQQKMLMPAFGFATTKSFFPIFRSFGLQFLHDLENEMENEIELHYKFCQLTLTIIGLSIFSYRFDAAENQKVSSAYRRLMNPINLLMILATVVWPPLYHFPFEQFEKERAATKLVREAVEELLQDRIKKKKETHGNDEKSKERPQDLMELLLAGDVDNQMLESKEILPNLLTFLIAGHETSSCALSWLTKLLATHPEVEERIREEIRQHVPDVNKMEWEDIQKLTLLTAAVKETLRLYPSAPELVRKLSEDDTLPWSEGPVELHKGDRISIPLCALHRLPQHFHRAEEFLPERFLDGSPEYEKDKALRNGKPITFYYLPFGRGARSCIGDRFAMAEITTLAAIFYSRFHAEISPSSDTNPYLLGITLKPKDFRVKLHHART